MQVNKALNTLKEKYEMSLAELDIFVWWLDDHWDEFKSQKVKGLRYTMWLEKTIVRGRRNREKGEFALGKVLWSPREDRRGGDIYSNMRARVSWLLLRC